MFLNQLSDKEKHAFLNLSYFAAKSNGIIEDAENEMIQEYCREMDLAPFVAETETSMDEIFHVFEESTESNKKIIVLELMGLMYADGDFDEAEREFVNRLVQSFGFETAIVESLEKVLIKYLDVVKEVRAVVF